MGTTVPEIATSVVRRKRKEKKMKSRLEQTIEEYKDGKEILKSCKSEEELKKALMSCSFGMLVNIAESLAYIVDKIMEDEDEEGDT